MDNIVIVLTNSNYHQVDFGQENQYTSQLPLKILKWRYLKTSMTKEEISKLKQKVLLKVPNEFKGGVLMAMAYYKGKRDALEQTLKLLGIEK